ncbi:septal ring lytic transglycosylase RlpA family protein [Rhizobiales bacterium]|uniref:septal ring lytic transglycosylase RlpA family protein n=1 Tax=Hongsoonwoonella zoysiae TaxID=2821844 RepID=UPI00156103B7|nr:septal ring lytic transglycosylase RlpA family protein [Hongsoonwoonella zoysiae]NRG18800.1 septal ring lytic transglycosylase RlpA family protein [Hongsoonwoonella zoysiae]
MRPKKQNASQASSTAFSFFISPRGAGATATALLCIAVAGCSSGPSEKKVKFSSAKYGVPASPKVIADGKPVPKGGGRAVVGKPYKVAGKWYKPKRDPNYEKVGYASWYGPTFHGRMTANGEIFDRSALTAAHTTLPLPSYARVTNLENGRSVTVRVNDRGPFHGNREIDLSERVATLLDYKHKGVAKVKVEYVGPARLDGRDEEFLLASYSGPGETTPGGTLPGTLLAQATPPASIFSSAPIPQTRPYGAFTTLASVDGQLQQGIEVAAFDPALAFEASGKTIQVASANAFVPSAQQLGKPYDLTLPAALNRPTGSPDPQPGVLGVLPVRNSGFDGGSAVSSYSARLRISAAYSAISEIGGGVSLAALAVKLPE